MMTMSYRCGFYDTFREKADLLPLISCLGGQLKARLSTGDQGWILALRAGIQRGY
jgi:hypothetical protein